MFWFAVVTWLISIRFGMFGSICIICGVVLSVVSVWNVMVYWLSL